MIFIDRVIRDQSKKVLFTLNPYNLWTHDRSQISMSVLETGESFFLEPLVANLRFFF